MEATPTPAGSEPDRDADVLVVGAGLAGLTCARKLARGGAAVLVLEARDRVGGRVEAAAAEGTGAPPQLGGQWVGPTQDAIKSLAEELGMETFPTPEEGKSLLELKGKRRTYSGAIPKVGPIALFDIWRARRRIDRLASTLEPGRPWTHPEAGDLDSMTLADWLAEKTWTKRARTLLRVSGRTIFGAEPEEISMLHAVHYVRGAGGFEPLISTEGGAQEELFKGGAHRLATMLAASLGDRVRLGAAVAGISQAARQVTVELESGERLTAARVVVAIPPPLRGELRFEPELTGVAARVPELAPLGRTAKCVVTYERPFWRDDGLSGAAVSDIGPVTLTFDSSFPGEERGILVGFVGGADLPDWREGDAEARREAILGCLERMFGPQAREPLEYLERDWTGERWTGGGPTSILAPGSWTEIGGALSEPAGLIHWAGTETADRWPGYMDGAVRSGERAAEEVLETL